MKKYEEFIEGLRQDVEVPQAVWSQYINTLEHIDQLSGQRKGGNRMNRNTGRKWISAAAVAGVLVAGTVLFSYADPVAASKIPLIGRIFEQVSENATYSGSYDNRLVLSQSEDRADIPDGTGSGTDSAQNKADWVNTVSDQGITLTIQEVYSDGYSVYLAAELQAQEGGFSRIPAHYTRQYDTKTSQSVHVSGIFKTDVSDKESALNNGYFEGKAVDDKTFIGMMKLDKDQYEASGGELYLEITDILYDDVNALDAEGIEPQCRFSGNWKLKVPYSVDAAAGREIPVQKENKDGFRIQKVFVSSSQLIVFTQTPYTTLSPDTYTREDFRRQWGKKNQEIAAADGTPVTYEDMLAKKMYEYSELAVYNQDGEALEVQYSDETKTVFAVQDHDLKKLRIYMANGSGEQTLLHASDEQEAKELAILEAEVDL